MLNPKGFKISDADLENLMLFIVELSNQRIRYVNQNAAQNLGYSRSEILEFSVGDIHPNEMEQMSELIEQVIRNGSWTRSDLHCLTKRGKFIDTTITGEIKTFDGIEYFIARVQPHKQDESTI